MTPEERIVELETRSAFQEKLLADQNLWLLSQQQTLESLEETVRILARQLKDLQSSSGAKPDQDQSSPHYIHR